MIFLTDKNQYKHYLYKTTRSSKFVDNPQIKWKGATMNNYNRNWQYAITKEVIGMHEVISPYDWNLDLEQNPDFAEWENELQNKKGE